MTTRKELREDALMMAIGILQSAKDPDHLFKHAKYLEMAANKPEHQQQAVK